MLSTIQLALTPLAFGLLFLLMLLYWVQAALFSYIKYKRLSVSVFYLSFVSLTSILILRWVESGHFPLSNLYESLLFLSWSFLLSQFLLESSGSQILWIRAGGSPAHRTAASLRQKDVNPSPGSISKVTTSLPQNKLNASLTSLQRDGSEFLDLLGVILSPLALISYAFAFLNLPKEMQKATSLVPALQSNWLMMHVTVMILSYAALLSGSILSMAFLLINRLQFEAAPIQAACTGDTNQSKTSSSGQLSDDKMVLCDKLDNLSYRILGLGFPLLTVGILSGAVWANSAWGSYWSWDPKETWALITWLVFAIYLHARITKGWSGQKPAAIATLGFFVVWFCYLGVNLLGSGLHSYGWFRA